MQFNGATILSLHNTLLNSSKIESAGHYKLSDNLIMEVKFDGTRSIRFEPTKAKDTKTAMDQLYLAYMDAKNDSGINELILIPCVILDFLCIHPFDDGNGRMSRLLFLLLLYKAGFDAGKYISFEEQINKRKNMYYDSLKKSSEGWHDNKNDYFYFVGNFLMNLFIVIKNWTKDFLQ